MSSLNHMIAETLRSTVQKLGPPPTQYDEVIKDIVSGQDAGAILSLGKVLDECRDSSSWTKLSFAFEGLHVVGGG